jgi:hypothetical protein
LDNWIELELCLLCLIGEYEIAHRANATLLFYKGESHAEIAEFLWLDDNTIRDWYKTF